jgi:alpha-tubulin suppressor-like RCC1 family protein
MISFAGIAHAEVPPFAFIAQGSTLSLALDENGTVWAWGSNYDGECGIPASEGLEYVTRPVAIHGLDNVTSIDAGELFVIALKKDGTVLTWGWSIFGDLGYVPNNTTYNQSREHFSPLPVPGLSDITGISAGQHFCVVLKSDGTVWTWGDNRYGQLGDGKQVTIDDYYAGAHRAEPGMVVGLDNVTYVSAGPINAAAVKDDGTVWVWGANSPSLFGKAGENSAGPLAITTPVQVKGLENVKEIKLGYAHALALKNDGTVWAWGDNSCGQLGVAGKEFSNTPVMVPGLSNVTQISAGEEHSVALEGDGTVWTWGHNKYGQLGDGTTSNSYSPVKVQLPPIKAVSARGFNTMALDYNGTIWMWGNNNYGQLGNGLSSGSMSSPAALQAAVQGPTWSGAPSQSRGDSTVLLAILLIILALAVGIFIYMWKR